MEGWYRPHSVTITEENSGKKKLGIESSLTSEALQNLIKSKVWYRQVQSQVFATAIAEYGYLCQEYHQTFQQLREQCQKVGQDVNELRQLLTELTAEVFHHLAGNLRFSLNPIPKDELMLQMEIRKLGKVDIRSFKNLQPAKHLTLRDLLELKSLLTTKIDLYQKRYQEIVAGNNRIPREKYKHCQNLQSQAIAVLERAIEQAKADKLNLDIKSGR